MMYLECLFSFKYQTQLDPHHGGMYVVIMDTECSDITAPSLQCSFAVSVNISLFVFKTGLENSQQLSRESSSEKPGDRKICECLLFNISY